MPMLLHPTCCCYTGSGCLIRQHMPCDACPAAVHCTMCFCLRFFMWRMMPRLILDTRLARPSADCSRPHVCSGRSLGTHSGGTTTGARGIQDRSRKEAEASR